MKSRRNRSHKSKIILLVLFCIFLTDQIVSIDFFKLKEMIIKNSWKKVGFIFIKPTFLLKDAGYSSNIYTYDKIEEPDYKANIGFNIDLSMFIGRRFILKVEETPYYTFYSEHKDFEYFNNGIKTTLFSWLGKFNFSYSYSYQDLKRQPTSEFGTDVVSKVRTNSVTVDYGSFDSFYLTLFYDDSIIKFEDDKYYEEFNLVENLNRNESSWGGQLNKVIFTRTILYLKGERYKYRYNFKDVKDGKGSRFSLGIKFPEVGPLEGDFSIGINYFNPADEFAVNFNKLFGVGKVSIRPVKRMRFKFGYLIDSFYSFWNESAYYYEKRYTVGIDYYIGKKLKAGYEYSSGNNKYYFLSGEPAGRTDSSETTKINIGYRLSGQMGIGIYYSSFSLSTDVIDFNRSYNFIGGYFTHDF